ncbi:hypothetical protein FB451DRAFT_1556002 [Mycena latifolia]|nr:hypothetical protein FB451DRAFT_1556002 [Mycena latifolia]
MPGKARPRKWSLSKKKAPARIALGREKNAPTAEEWATMTEYHGFEVADEDGKEYKFTRNENVRVLPNRRKVGDPINNHEYWVCKILDIRANGEDGEANVWARIEWYYSAHDAVAVVPSFNASHCGLYERLRSNHIDCVSSSVFDGAAIVKEYDEKSLDQDAIFEDEYYCRYTIDLANKSIFPDPCVMCICGLPYNPSDAAPGSLMHFCPNPGCRKYYHSSCIAPKGAPPAAERDRGFLFCDPDTGVQLELDSISSASEPPKKRRRTSHTALAPPGLSLLDALPPVLVTAAAQPIVKGAAFPAGGVVGNAAAVMMARRLVFEAVRDGHKVKDGWEAHMPDGWEALVDVRLGASAVRRPRGARRASIGSGPLNGKAKGKAKAKDSEQVLALQCPECGGAI